MKFFVVAFVAIATFHLCLAKPKAKAPAKSPLEELSENAQSVITNVTKALGIKELPDTKKVVQVLNENTQTLANHVQEIASKLQGEVKAHQGEIDNVIKSVQEKLSATAESLQKMAGPEATAKAKEIKSNLDNGLKTVAAEIDRLVKAVEPDATKAKSNIENATQTFLNQLVEVGNKLQSQVKATVAEHEKSHHK